MDLLNPIRNIILHYTTITTLILLSVVNTSVCADSLILPYHLQDRTMEVTSG